MKKYYNEIVHLTANFNHKEEKMIVPKFLRFLVVDDIDSVRVTVENNLRTLGFEGPIQSASNVGIAKQYLSQAPYDLIISDWNMPGESGLDLLKFVRGHPQLQNIPFIMLTTENEADKVLDAIECGASNYLIKPWTLTDLEQKIKTSWKKHQKS